MTNMKNIILHLADWNILQEDRYYELSLDLLKEFKTKIERSSWVAMRILPSSHTNPVFVIVDGQPIRASRKSAEWCRAAVDRCWEMKSPAIRDSEQGQAANAYDSARAAYDAIAAESFDDR